MAARRAQLHYLLTIFGLAGFIMIILLYQHQFESFWHDYRLLRWYMILVVIAVLLGSYLANSICYRSTLKMFNRKVKISHLFGAGLAANFVNYILPSAGLAGTGYFSQALSPDVARGESVLTQLTHYALSALALIVTAPLGLALIILNSSANRAIVRPTVFSAAGIFMFTAILIAFIEQEKKLRQSSAWLDKKISSILTKLGGKEISTEKFLNDFYQGYRVLTSKKIQLLKPFAWTVIYVMVEWLSFYLVFAAFDRYVNPGIIIMFYFFSSIASIVGGNLFSLGIYELGSAGILVVLGVPFALALAVNVTYRVLSIATGIPLGFYYYRRYLPRTLRTGTPITEESNK